MIELNHPNSLHCMINELQMILHESEPTGGTAAGRAVSPEYRGCRTDAAERP